MTKKERLNEYSVGDFFSGILYLKSLNENITSTNKQYLTVILEDKSSQIEMKIWENVDSFKSNYQSGNLLNVEGVIIEYNNEKQIKLNNCSMADPSLDVFHYINSAPKHGSVYVNTLYRIVDQMKNPIIKQTVQFFLDKHKELLIYRPASKVIHHDYLGGLAYHIVSMLNLGERFSNAYSDVINKDLLYGAIILHDLGKNVEYEELENNYQLDVGIKGHLIGHISIMQAELEVFAKSCNLVDSEEIMLLQHLVLSHHGKKEWGSPVLPLIPEAVILHTIDKIDADMDTIKAKMKETKTGSLSSKIYSLENRRFYKSPLTFPIDN